MTARDPIDARLLDMPKPPIAWGERAQLICGGPVFLVVDVDGGIAAGSIVTLAPEPGCGVRELSVPRWGVRRVK